MIVTETVRQCRSHYWTKVSMFLLGLYSNYSFFFVTYAREKKMSLCLCKLCLNTKSLQTVFMSYTPSVYVLHTFMSKTKKDGDENSTSITSFLLYACSCPKGGKWVPQMAVLNSKMQRLQRYKTCTIKMQFIKRDSYL